MTKHSINSEEFANRIKKTKTTLKKTSLSLKDVSSNKKSKIDFSLFPYLTGKKSVDHSKSLIGNIERFLGYAQVPIGLAGPLLINNNNRFEEYYVPLATTEGALVASYNRGMKAFFECGGLQVACVDQGVQRSPYFKLESLAKANELISWVKSNESSFQSIVASSSNYAILKSIDYLQEGNSVIVTFSYETGAAAGQNMVTIATDEICQFIVNSAPTEIAEWYIESNYAGDKKSTLNALNSVRGKRVIAECIIPRNIVMSVLKSSPEAMVQYWQTSNLAMMQSGSIGNQGHVANALTALYLACGQDVACVTESASGIIRMEINKEKNLYVSLTLPSLIVGTIGGGTGLSTQKECLEILNCNGPEYSERFAEICCATAMAGEISIAAAIAEGHFTSAHQSLGRKSK